METKVKLWAAHDEYAFTVWLYRSKPTYYEDGNGYWASLEDTIGNIDDSLLPQVTFNSSPVEVEITFTTKDKTPVMKDQNIIRRNGTEYIRKDIVDDMLKTAEDHAYLAGSESVLTIEALRTEYEKGRADVIVEIEKCYEKAITADAQAYLIKDLLDRLKTKK